MVELKGLHVVRSKGKTYVYAWRGGPRIDAQLGTPAFVKAYNEAIESHRIPDATKFRAHIQAYKASRAFQTLAPTTRKIWSRWLDRIDEQFGSLVTAAFDRPQVIKPRIRKWLSTWDDKPRSRDYAKQVLSRVMTHIIEQGEISANPCEGIESVYETDRSEIIWTDDDIATLRAIASPEVMHAVDLAAQCGLRSADLFRLAWSHVQDDSIVIRTSKSRFKREAVIPIHDELRAVLDRIPRRSTIVLTNSDGQPWRGFSSSFKTALKRAGMGKRDLHFHDLRGTAATKFYMSGLPIRTVAEVMGWSEDEVEKIIRRYVGRKAAVQDAIQRMRARSGTDGVKPAVKPAQNGEG